MSVRWCCRRFQDHHGIEPSRGTYVVATGAAAMDFYLVTQAVDEADQVTLRERDLEFPIAVRGCVSIQYCPWCGAHLRQQYAFANKLPVAPEPCGTL